MVESAPLPSDTMRVEVARARGFVAELFEAAGFEGPDAAPVGPQRHTRSGQVFAVDDHVGGTRDAVIARQLYCPLGFVTDAE